MCNVIYFQQNIDDEGGIPPLETLESVKALLKIMDCKDLWDVNVAAKDWMDFDELLCGREESRKLQNHIVAARRKVYEECRAVYGANDEKTIEMMTETASLLENLKRYEEAVALREDIVAVCQGKYGGTARETTGHIAAILEDLLCARKIGELQTRIEIEMNVLMKAIRTSRKNLVAIETGILDGIFNVYDALEATIHLPELKLKSYNALRDKTSRDLQAVRGQIAEVCNRLLAQEDTRVLDSIRRMPRIFYESGEYASAIAMQKKIIKLRQKASGQSADRKALYDDLEALADFYDKSGRRREGIHVREGLVALNRKMADECRIAERFLEGKEQKHVAEIEDCIDAPCLSGKINDSLAIIRELHLICLRERIHNLDELAWNLQKAEDMDGFMKTKEEFLKACRKWKNLGTTAEEVEEATSWIEDTKMVLGRRDYEEEENESHWPAGGDASCEGYIPCGVKHI